MKVIVHEPKPVPQPPKTYDLVGLTGAEMQILRDITGDQFPLVEITRVYEVLRQHFPSRATPPSHYTPRRDY